MHGGGLGIDDTHTGNIAVALIPVFQQRGVTRARGARAAAHRAAAIRERFFDAGRGLFVDLRLPDGVPGDSESLACAYPLFCGIASEDQAQATAARLREHFLQAGGWQTSLVVSGLQWDAPSGWAPLQWICYRAPSRYGFAEDAAEGARRWVQNNLGVYRESGRLMERYDVVDVGKVASGGEYHVQDGFGWTNGAEWYTTRGDTTDYTYMNWGMIDTTLECTNTKAPSSSQIARSQRLLA